VPTYPGKLEKRIFCAAANFLLAADISLKQAFQLRSFFAGDFAGGGVISPGFNGVAGLGIDGASGGGSGAGSLSL
jgi:hypothetical protein